MVKLNDWEIAFIGRFIEYYNLYKGSSVKTQTVIEVLSKEMAIDPDKVLNSFYTLLKKGLSIEPSAIENFDGLISDELIENLRKHGFSYPVLKFRFPKRTSYRDIKFKNNLLYSRGEDGLVRFWIYYEGVFYFLKEIGELNGNYGPYEVIDDYLYYAKDNKLIVYNIKSEIKINEREFPYKIEALELNENIIYVYYGKIKQGVRIFDNEIVYDLADVYDKLPQSVSKIELGDGFVIVHEGQIIYAKENNKSFSKIREYEIPSENAIRKIGKYILFKDNVYYLYDLLKNNVVLSLSDEMAFNYKNDIFISFDKLNNLKIYELNDFKNKKIIKLSENVYSLDFNEDYLILGSDGYIIVYKLKSKFLFREFSSLKKFKKIDISKGKIIILKIFEDYIFAYSDEGILKVLSLNDFSEISSIKANFKDFFYYKNYLVLIYEDKVELCKINGQVQKVFDIKVSSYFVYNKEIIFGTEDGKVIFLNDSFEIDREFQVSKSRIKFISDFDKYILLCDDYGFHLFTTNWEIIQILSHNPSKSIIEVKRFDDYLSIAFKNGEIKTYHRDGSLKSAIKTKGFQNNEIIIDNDIKFLAFDDGYIIIKGNKFYGSNNCRDYIYFVDGYDIIMSDNYYNFYEDENLFNQIALFIIK